MNFQIIRELEARTFTPPSRKAESREEWLNQAWEIFAEVLASKGYEIPAVQFSMGYGPRTRKAGSKAECWIRELSEGANTIFIAPDENDIIDILISVAHEGIHAVDNCKSGHRGDFVEMCKVVGLEGPYASTPDVTDAMRRFFHQVAIALGPLGHRKFDPATGKTILSGILGTAGGGMIKDNSNGGKQKTYMRKAECLTDGCDAAADGFKVRLTVKHIDAHGAPKCPVCDKELTVEEK